MADLVSRQLLLGEEGRWQRMGGYRTEHAQARRTPEQPLLDSHSLKQLCREHRSLECSAQLAATHCMVHTC